MEGASGLSDWQSNYGATTIAVATSVPEPDTITGLASLAAVAQLIVRRRRRRHHRTFEEKSN